MLKGINLPPDQNTFKVSNPLIKSISFLKKRKYQQAGEEMQERSTKNNINREQSNCYAHLNYLIKLHSTGMITVFSSLEWFKAPEECYY